MVEAMNNDEIEQTGKCALCKKIAKTLRKKLPSCSEVARAELFGYKHVTKQYQNATGLAPMKMNIVVFTVIFTIMSLESVFRAADWIAQWTQPVVVQTRPDDLDFSSQYAVPANEALNAKYLQLLQNGPGLLCQALFCLVAMAINNALWVRRKSFSVGWHTAHYVVASLILIIYLPRKTLWPAMTDVKYLLTAMNIFAFQLFLGQIASLAVSHQLLIMTVTIVDLALSTKTWFAAANEEPLALWDTWLHLLLPLSFMVAHAVITMKERICQDQQMTNEYEDMKKVLGSLTQGVALTVDIPTKAKLAYRAARKEQDALRRQNSKRSGSQRRQTNPKGAEQFELSDARRKVIEIEDLEQPSATGQNQAPKESQDNNLVRKSSIRRPRMPIKTYQLQDQDVLLTNTEIFKIIATSQEQRQINKSLENSVNDSHMIDHELLGQNLKKIYTKKCLKSLDCFSTEEANERVIDNSMNSDCVSNYLSVKDAENLVSLFDILRRNRSISMYYQVFPNQIKVSESQASQMIMEEESQSKIIKLEVRTLRLSDNIIRQLLVISDITHVLRFEKKKMKHNFQQQLVASLAHEQLTPLNSIVNVTQILQKELFNVIMTKKYGDPNKLPASRASASRTQSNVLLKTILEDQVKLFEYSTIIWSSAQIMQHMILSQMSHTKLNMKMLMVKFHKLEKPVTSLVLDFLKPFNHQLKMKGIKVEVVQGNEIPSWANTDWDLFLQILFHLVSNSIKFNKDNGSITIITSFHTFEEEFCKEDGLENAQSNSKIGMFNYGNLIDKESQNASGIQSDRLVSYSKHDESKQKLLHGSNNDEQHAPACHSEQQSDRVMIDTSGTGRNWGYLLTQVIDTGEGIAASTLTKLFSTFTSSSISQFKSQGVGIGLSTAKELCQSMCGGVTLISSPSEGTHICFSIQMRSSEEKLNQKKMQETTIVMRQDLPSRCVIKDPLLNQSQLDLSHAGDEMEDMEDNDCSAMLLDSSAKRLSSNQDEMEHSAFNKPHITSNLVSTEQQQVVESKQGRVFHASCIKSEIEALHNTVLNNSHKFVNSKVTIFEEEKMIQAQQVIQEQTQQVIQEQTQPSQEEQKHRSRVRGKKKKSKKRKNRNAPQTHNNELLQDDSSNAVLIANQNAQSNSVADRSSIAGSSSIVDSNSHFSSVAPRSNQQVGVGQGSSSRGQQRSNQSMGQQQPQQLLIQLHVERQIQQNLTVRNDRSSYNQLIGDRMFANGQQNPSEVLPNNQGLDQNLNRRRDRAQSFNARAGENQRQPPILNLQDADEGIEEEKVGGQQQQRCSQGVAAIVEREPSQQRQPSNKTPCFKLLQPIREKSVEQSLLISDQNDKSQEAEGQQIIEEEKEEEEVPVFTKQNQLKNQSIQENSCSLEPQLRLIEEVKNSYLPRLAASQSRKADMKEQLSQKQECETIRKAMLENLNQRDKQIMDIKKAAIERQQDGQRALNAQIQAERNGMDDANESVCLETVPEEETLPAASIGLISLQRVQQNALKPCCNKATVLMTSRFLTEQSSAEPVPLSTVLRDKHGIESVTLAFSSEVEDLIAEFTASLQKKCCDSYFMLVLLDPSQNGAEVNAGIQAQLQQVLEAAQIDHQARQAVVIAISSSEGDEQIKSHQVEIIVRIHKQLLLQARENDVSLEGVKKHANRYDQVIYI